MTLRGRIGAALTVDPDATLYYVFTTNRTSTSTRKLHLIGHHATGRRTGCTLAGCSPLRWKAPCVRLRRSSGNSRTLAHPSVLWPI
jgi:hypothetical protein